VNGARSGLNDLKQSKRIAKIKNPIDRELAKEFAHLDDKEKKKRRERDKIAIMLLLH
jgi:hypothetical protein